MNAYLLVRAASFSAAPDQSVTFARTELVVGGAAGFVLYLLASEGSQGIQALVSAGNNATFNCSFPFAFYINVFSLAILFAHFLGRTLARLDVYNKRG